MPIEICPVTVSTFSSSSLNRMPVAAQRRGRDPTAQTIGQRPRIRGALLLRAPLATSNLVTAMASLSGSSRILTTGSGPLKSDMVPRRVSLFPSTPPARRSAVERRPLRRTKEVLFYASLYKSRPSGRLGDEDATFFRNARLRSLFASLCFRWRWNRALSPLIADMVTQA